MQLFSRNKAIVALSLGALALGACGDDVTVPVTPAAPITLSITPPSANMNIGESVNFAVQISGGSATSSPTITCTSSSATVATATVSGSACRVTAVAAGNATITAAASTGQSAAASVSVAAPAAAISGLQVSPTAASVPVNQTVTIVPTFNRAGSAVTGASQFTTSNAAVATVNATTGVVTAVAPGVATITVSVTGSGTGFTTTTLTAAAAITVTALPTGITSLNVTPATLSLASGATATVVATAQQPAGATAAMITFGTTAPAVATVNTTTGVVTAVGPGTAVITVTATSAANTNFAAATLSGTVAVTVSPAAQVSIAGVVNAAGDPVSINTVNGQIGVDVAITTNGQNVSSAQVFICNAGAAACPAAGQAPAAQQQFGAGGANSGTIRMLINTADFTVDWTAGTATVANTNGQKNVIATITTGSTGSANSNLAILNFTNTDGWAGLHRQPNRTSVASNGSAFFGGPGTDGQGTMTVAPVIYTVGRSVSAFSVGISGCATTTTFTSADARPYTVTYGAFAAATGKQANCAYQTLLAGAPDVTGSVNAGLDNNNLAYVGAAAGAFATTTSNPTAVGQPATIRVDYVAPAGYTFVVNPTATSIAGWVNGAYNFATNTGNIAGLSDLGVGLVTTRNVEVRGCPVPTTTGGWTALSSGTGADIAECATDFGITAYEARFTGADRLTNTGAAVVATQRFGVDKTAPQLRYAAATDASGTIYGSAALPTDNAAADTVFSAQAIDERSGLLTTGATYAQARTNAAAATCLSGAAATAIGSTPQTAPNCAFAAGGWGAATADGWRQMTGGVLDVNTGAGAQTQGYYTYQPRATDQAGNVTTLADVRSILIQYNVPAAVTPTALPVTTPAITAASALTFNGTVTDGIEASISSFQLAYGANVFAFSASATANATFDNIIPGFGTATTGQSALTGSTPFASGTRIYTGIEAVDATGNITAGGAETALSNFGFFANNFGGAAGLVGTAPIGIAVTADAGASAPWSAKALNSSTFVLTNSAAGFNAPAGGLKAQVTSTVTQLNSPVSRVDFYIANAGGVNEYVGTVTPDCDPASATRNCYIADIGVVRTWTYRYTGALANSSTSTATRAYPAGVATNLRAVATLVTAGVAQGRGLFTNFPATVTVAAP